MAWGPHGTGYRPKCGSFVHGGTEALVYVLRMGGCVDPSGKTAKPALLAKKPSHEPVAHAPSGHVGDTHLGATAAREAGHRGDRLGHLLARAVQDRRALMTDAPPVRGVLPGSARGLLQRVLEEFPGPETRGQANVKGAGLKELLRETDDGKLYFKSLRSTGTDWLLIEVKLSGDGRNYEKTGQERTVKAQKKVPRTLKDWGPLAYIQGTTMLYPTAKYPHVTIDLKRPVWEPTDVVDFETMHYSRSNDDPYRSGYRRMPDGWVPVYPNDRKDKQKECDDAVDGFLATVGLPDRVIRA